MKSSRLLFHIFSLLILVSMLASCGGGSVATQMGYDLSQASSIDLVAGSGHFSVIAYLGYSDAATAIANGGKELAYNGVMESTANIQQGLYTFWGNEFIYKKNVGLSSQASSVFNKLASGIGNHADGTSFISSGSMNAVRNGPTSDPVHL